MFNSSDQNSHYVHSPTLYVLSYSESMAVGVGLPLARGAVVLDGHVHVCVVVHLTPIFNDPLTVCLCVEETMQVALHMATSWV